MSAMVYAVCEIITPKAGYQFFHKKNPFDMSQSCSSYDNVS